MKDKEKLPELIEVGNRLKEIRKEKGFTNYEHIAYELGMSRSAYWRLENGDNFSLKTLIKVCKIMGITFEEFFTGVNVPKAEKRKKRSRSLLKTEQITSFFSLIRIKKFKRWVNNCVGVKKSCVVIEIK